MAKQTEFEGEGFEQDKVAEIESAADKYNERKVIWQGLGKEVETLNAKVREVVHAHADKCDRTKEGTIRYNRGDYSIEVSSKEKLKVKIAGAEEEAEVE